MISRGWCVIRISAFPGCAYLDEYSGCFTGVEQLRWVLPLFWSFAGFIALLVLAWAFMFFRLAFCLGSCFLYDCFWFVWLMWVVWLCAFCTSPRISILDYL